MFLTEEKLFRSPRLNGISNSVREFTIVFSRFEDGKVPEYELPLPKSAG